MSEKKNIEDEFYVPPPKAIPNQSAAVKAVEKAAKSAEEVREVVKNKSRFWSWKLHKYEKIRNQLIPLEPLCCLSSSIIREGCAAAAFLEICGALVTTAIISLDMWKRHFRLWAPLPRHSIKELFLHPVFYYIICVHNVILLLTMFFVVLGIYLFSKRLIAIKYYYCHVSLIVHLLALLFSLYVLCTPGTIKWTYTAAALVFCFSVQIVLEVWAIAVIGACKNFFNMIDTFTSMAS